MVTREQLIGEARKYLGVPYRHQGRDLSGLDCGGLLLVVGRSLGLTALEHLGYANSPDGQTFERLLNQELDPVEDWRNPQVADILAMDYGKGIQHTAIVTETEPRLKIIHAKRPRGGMFASTDRGVIETYIHGVDLRAWCATFHIRGIE